MPVHTCQAQPRGQQTASVYVQKAPSTAEDSPQISHVCPAVLSPVVEVWGICGCVTAVCSGSTGAACSYCRVKQLCLHLSSPWCCHVSIAIVPGSLCCRSGGALCYFVQSNHKIMLRPVCRARGDRWRRAAQGRHGARRLGSQ